MAQTLEPDRFVFKFWLHLPVGLTLGKVLGLSSAVRQGVTHLSVVGRVEPHNICTVAGG